MDKMPLVLGLFHPCPLFAAAIFLMGPLQHICLPTVIAWALPKGF
jgi:hypothetical protein